MVMGWLWGWLAIAMVYGGSYSPIEPQILIIIFLPFSPLVNDFGSHENGVGSHPAALSQSQRQGEARFPKSQTLEGSRFFPQILDFAAASVCGGFRWRQPRRFVCFADKRRRTSRSFVLRFGARQRRRYYRGSHQTLQARLWRIGSRRRQLRLRNLHARRHFLRRQKLSLSRTHGFHVFGSHSLLAETRHAAGLESAGRRFGAEGRDLPASNGSHWKLDDRLLLDC